jgi:tetratricopeptide (TPR) repeat protein
MTKTIFATVCLVAVAHAASAQSFTRRAPRPAPVPAPAPFVFAPAPPVAPAPPAAPVPAAPQVLPVPAPPAPPPGFLFLEPPSPAEPPQFVFEPPDFDFSALEQSMKDVNDSIAAMKLEEKVQKLNEKAMELNFNALAFDQPFVFAQGPGKGSGPSPLPIAGIVSAAQRRDEGLYDQARNMIERNQYEKALPTLDRIIESKGTRAEAAMYWKAYSLSKLARRNEALTAVADLQKQYPNSPWVNDAKGLEVELRQAAGQSVSPDMADDEMRVLALRGVMQSNPETALPAIEKLLAGNSSVRVKDRALFLLSQNQSARAREVIAGVATKASNPDLRMSAVRYLGMRSEPESLRLLNDIYNSTSDVDMKQSIIRSFRAANARDRLLAIARSERNADLRAVAVQQLGAVRGGNELEELYRAESDKEVKQRILQAIFVSNATDKLARIAREERDADLQRAAIRNLGATNRPEATEALRAIYTSTDSVDTKKAVISALGMQQQNCTPLVTLAKAERNRELQTEIVQRLSNMTNRCTDARDYMLEIIGK